MSLIRGYDNQRVVTVDAGVDYTASPVVSAADLQAWLGVSGDDALLLSLQAAAAQWVESYTWRRLAEHTQTLRLDHFPGHAPRGMLASDGIDPGQLKDFGIVLDWTPVTAVTAFTYTQEDGTSGTTYDADNYDVVLGSDAWQARIMPADAGASSTRNTAGGWTMPTSLRSFDALRITYTVGYGAGAVPEQITTAIKMMVAHMYENRGDCADCGSCAAACGAKMLLTPFRPIW
jgi:uncharacterized phiE125 gp8 family phage protein